MTDPWVENVQYWFNYTYGERPGFSTLQVTGRTGWATLYALTRALQFELGIAALSDNFGAGTLAALKAYGNITATFPDTSSSPSNIIKIAQAALYCKGYNASNGDLTGVWSTQTQAAMKSLRDDLGFGAASSALHPKIFKFLLTMEAAKLLPGGDSVVRDGQRAMNARYVERRDYFIVPADGYFLRDTHRALLLALQYEIEMEDGTANGNFGPGTKSGLEKHANLTTGATDSGKILVRLFHFALRVNGHPTTFSGTFTAGTSTHVRSFQSFVGLPSTGTANVQTWASLLVSTGDPARPGAGADCITTLTPARLQALRAAGYQYFGRYLTNATDHNPDKDLKQGEVANILNAGGRLFPLFQTGGGSPSHFTPQRGAEVAEEAANAAWAYRLPANSVIYFSVDYDAYDWEVTDSIIPYFRAVNDNINLHGQSFRVGIYGPRNVCKRVSAEGLAVYSFVSDMSTGYSGNLGHSLPGNWAFDQIATITVSSGATATEIDKNIVSGRDAGVTALAPATNVGNDPRIPSDRLDAFELEWKANCMRLADSPFQAGLIQRNAAGVKALIASMDGFITALASEYGVYKAFILTPLIWESLVINAADDAGDHLVRVYYGYKEAGLDPLDPVTDSSTGVCQIFAATAITCRNWAVDQGLLVDRKYDHSRWQDMWEMWKKLNTDIEFNIRTGLYVMMKEAVTRTGVPAGQLRTLTPSQVMRTLQGYNGGDIYGRRRVALFYLIQRWHQSFR